MFDIWFTMYKRTGGLASLGMLFSLRNYRLTREIEEYAKHARDAVYTFDDLFATLGGHFNYSIGQHEVEGGDMFENLDWDPPHWVRTTVYLDDAHEAPDNAVLDRWLLTKEEVADPVHTSPDELERILRALPEETLTQRLKAHLIREGEDRYRSVGGWEKPSLKLLDDKFFFSSDI